MFLEDFWDFWDFLRLWRVFEIFFLRFVRPSERKWLICPSVPIPPSPEKKHIKATNKGNQRTKKTSGVRWSVFKHVHRGRFSLAWFPEQTRLVLTQWQIVQAKDGRVWLLATNILQSQAFGAKFLNKLNLFPHTWVVKQMWQLKTFRHTLSVHKGDSSENYLNIDPSRFWRPFVDTVWHFPNF